jgi:hypothetical protein
VDLTTGETVRVEPPDPAIRLKITDGSTDQR